jgi:hypothetical protein
VADYAVLEVYRCKPASTVVVVLVGNDFLSLQEIEQTVITSMQMVTEQMWSKLQLDAPVVLPRLYWVTNAVA